MENTPKEENAIRAVLRNELTWIIFVIGTVFSSLVWIILPLNNLQKDVAQIKSDIAEIKTISNNGITKDGELNNRLTILETKIDIRK